MHTSPSSGKQKTTTDCQIEHRASPDSIKTTIRRLRTIKGKLLVAEQWFLRNKKAERCPLDVAESDRACSRWFTLYFDEAVEIIRRDVDETLSSLVHEINRVRKEFPRDD